MTSNWNVKFSPNSVLALLLGGFIVFGSAVPAKSDDQAQIEGHLTGQAGIMEQSWKSTVGRMFGVAGEPSDIRYNLIELDNRTPRNAALRSAILPGWGQSFNHQKTKARVTFWSFLALSGGALLSNHRAGKAKDEYDLKGIKNDPTYDDYKSYQTQSFVLGGFAVALWAFSIFDAKNNAYRSLYSENHRIKFAFNSDKADVQLEHRFQ